MPERMHRAKNARWLTLCGLGAQQCCAPTLFGLGDGHSLVLASFLAGSRARNGCATWSPETRMNGGILVRPGGGGLDQERWRSLKNQLVRVRTKSASTAMVSMTTIIVEPPQNTVLWCKGRSNLVGFIFNELGGVLGCFLDVKWKHTVLWNSHPTGCVHPCVLDPHAEIFRRKKRCSG
jgi:hypothetical protein